MSSDLDLTTLTQLSVAERQRRSVVEYDVRLFSAARLVRRNTLDTAELAQLLENNHFVRKYYNFVRKTFINLNNSPKHQILK